MLRAWPMVVPVALALVGCQPPGLTARGGMMAETRVGAPAARIAPQIVVTGVAQAPASLVTNNGSGVIANQGGLVIANGGGSVIANGGGSLAGPRYGLLAAPEALVPVPGAEVVLLAADGRPFPGVAPTKTDALGRFALAGVPEGGVAFVEIRGQGFRLGRLLKASAEAVQVDPVSTAVADGMRAKLKDARAIAQLQAADLGALTAAVQAASDAGELAIDLRPGASADQALAQALAKRPEAAQAADAAAAQAREAAAQAAEPATPAQPDAAAPAVPADPAQPNARGGDANAALPTPGGDQPPAGATRPNPDGPPANDAAPPAAGPGTAPDGTPSTGGQPASGGGAGNAAGSQPTGDGPPVGGDQPAPGGGASPDPGKGKPGDKGKP